MANDDDFDAEKATTEIVDAYTTCLRSLGAAMEAGAITKIQYGHLMYACAMTIVTMGLPDGTKAILGASALQYANVLNKLTGSLLT